MVRLTSLNRLASVAMLALTCILMARSEACAQMSPPKNTILGTSLSPAHIPHQSGEDIVNFFGEAAQIGSHVTWICEWETMPPLATIKVVQNLIMQHGLKFHFYLSPIALTGGRRAPAIPASVGGTSFKDPKVRQAYKDEVLTLAAFAPDYLGLATEANFLAQNPDEFAAFVSLARETYDAVKQKYPAQIVTVSFQWDVMVRHQQFDVLKQFADSLDVYSFTSYPDAFGLPFKIPDDYYSSVRKILPDARLGFSEIGWSSAAPSSEDQQAEFYQKIPRLMNDTRSEYVTLALLHDVEVFTSELARLNAVGIRRVDDTPKKSWEVVVAMPELSGPK
jgi:hypothetical protein